MRGSGERPQPLRVVLASGLQIPEAARICDRAARPHAALLVIGAEGERPTRRGRGWLREGRRYASCRRTSGGRCRWPHALAILHERGVKRLLVEGGARVLTSFLREGLADRAAIEIAPRMSRDTALAGFGALGEPCDRGEPRRRGSTGREPWVPPIALRGTTVERLGENLLLRGDLEYSA